MLDRDAQTLTISRQGLLLVTAMGVGLLTLVYVLGVQVGKQSASLNRTSARVSGEDLKELPAPLADQLKPFEGPGSSKPASPAPPPQAQAEPPAPEPKPQGKPESKPEAKPEAAGKWTLQLVSTTDSAEAARVVAKAKAAGYTAVVVKDKKLHKVRLAKPLSREAADAAAASLKAKGLKPFATKAE